MTSDADDGTSIPEIRDQVLKYSVQDLKRLMFEKEAASDYRAMQYYALRSIASTLYAIALMKREEIENSKNQNQTTV
ncbi:hypothetical protein [Bifidobacterium oedipodis]|uniref:Uncharacterized protein n=1 Tax=Bifidobacterium oedipodis TaxID=2675322 RepID=A0A7Y0EP94_9BIFI|nr:hypothetical protein [Bifidobacterium sp. DSM 109957]NMM93920.1 hypothetical protein [Bifidobacterium sp. DSM 109957]